MNSFSFNSDILHVENVSLVKISKNVGTPLYVYSKKQFDPFCRRERINFKYDKDKSVIPVKTNKSIFFKRVSTSKKETSKMPLFLLKIKLPKNRKKIKNLFMK